MACEILVNLEVGVDMTTLTMLVLNRYVGMV